MRSPLDRVPAGIITLSDDMRITSANVTMGVMAGQSQAELLGQPIDILLTPASRILFQTHLYPALKAQGRVDEMLLQLDSDSPGGTPVLLNALRDDVEPGTSYTAVLLRFQARSRWESDLLTTSKALADERSASQQLAHDMAARHEQSQRDRRYRDAFMGVLSHELRTPITTIYGMSHLLRQRHSTMSVETLTQHLLDIEAEADRLHRLTEDLLVITRVEGGRLEIEPDPIAISPLIERIVSAERARVPDREFRVEKPNSLPLIAGEDLYVEQVLRNYLSNAGKYSPPGSPVSVVVSVEGGGVAVRVLDNGPGLGTESPDQLFELFYRAPQATRQASGAGIGLFVCRELVGAMGGRVWAASASGGGEFGFWLPELLE